MTTRPDDTRRGIEARLLNLSREAGVDVNRLRRHLVFQRMLTRLSLDGGWVLKGGFALELRLRLDARATKDLDLAVLEYGAGVDIQELLQAALDRDVDADGFSFDVHGARPISPDDAGSPGWRVPVTSRMARREFQRVVIDVVARSEEIAGSVEDLLAPSMLTGLDHRDALMPTVGVHQHAAEKLHALARRYPGDRPSSRVKDLIDLVLLIEAGLLDPHRLGLRLTTVYNVRDHASPPVELPELPAAWRVTYPAMAAEVSVAAADLDTADDLVRRLYAAALPSGTPIITHCPTHEEIDDGHPN